MTILRPRRPHPAFIALVPLLLLATGCAQDAAPQATVTATVTAAPSADAGAGQQGQGQGQPQPSQEAPKASWSRPAKPVQSPPAAARPELEDFRGMDKNGYFFTSPSGNLHCGFVEENMQYMGCQSRSAVEGMSYCDDPSGLNAPAISLARGEAGYPDCLGTGVFTDRGARVLAYGQQLELGAYTCSSSESGVTCNNTVDGHGFSASRRGFNGW